MLAGSCRVPHSYAVRVEKPRQIAVRVLQRHAARREYLETVLDDVLAAASLSPVDRGLVQELTCGVVRWQAALDWLIGRKTAGRTQKPGLQMLLRLGLYQMFWLDRIPDHAAVHETVELAKQLGFGAQAGFVNAVLRGYLRERGPTEQALQALRQTQPALGWSHPAWLSDRWEKRWGPDALWRLLEWNNRPPLVYARRNTLKADVAVLTAEWSREGVRFALRPCDWAGEGMVFRLNSHPPLPSLPSFQRGLFYVQDPSTLLAVHVLDPRPGEVVLDLCAAPGGKTTHIAQLMQDRGRIVAHDSQPGRLQWVRENCERLGVGSVELTSSLPELARPGPRSVAPAPRAFDRVLVDAPCSNTGVLRRRVDLRWRLRPEEIHRLRAVQLDLLQQAVLRTKAGGTLVYSTCSLEPEENREVVEEFLRREPRTRLATERQLTPFADEVDGAYVARLTVE
jgi:16S rRNA (cytosine967-C5)-methyltransferase